MLQKIKILVAVVVLIVVVPVPVGAAVASWKSSTLVTIDAEKYTAEDYLSWWNNWREKGMNVPESPQSYVDWLLLSGEARRMELYTSENFKKKVNTFLKVRSLLMLKQEEVDTKINISDDEIRERYEKYYLPLWQVNVISFQTVQEADKAYEKLLDGSVTVEGLHTLKSEEGGAISVRSRIQRPFNTHEEWQKILREMDESDFSMPQLLTDKFVILHLLSVQAADEKDFEKVRSEIRKKLRKEKQAILTSQLIEKLIEKYNVQVDNERLDAIDTSAPDTELTDHAVMTYKDGKLSEIEFMKMYRRQEQQNRSLGVRSTESLPKQQVLSGIISQTFTTKEAVERHYEKKEPLASVFNFYLGHRLVRELEKQVFVPQVKKIEHDEIEAYYKDNADEFNIPGIYHVGVVKGSKKDLQAIWKKTIIGDEFLSVAKETFPHTPIEKVISEVQIDEDLKKVITQLNTGQVSQVFPYKGQYAMIKLLSYKSGSTVPLGPQLATSIQEKIQKAEIDQLRSDFLKKLRNNVVIETDATVWKKIYTELKQDAENEQ